MSHTKTSMSKESYSVLTCNCGREFRDKQALNRHQATNCPNQSVVCSFCIETFPSSIAIGEHLMICGNKTDQCPNCKMFIRRAIFAYHYENNCTDPDDSIGITQYSSGPSLVNNRNNGSSATSMMMTTSFPQPQNTKKQMTVFCMFCHEDFTEDNYKIHKKDCRQRPPSITERQPEQETINYNQNRSLHNKHNDNDIVYIPCQFCDEPVELNHIVDHQSQTETSNTKIKNELLLQDPPVYIVEHHGVRNNS